MSIIKANHHLSPLQLDALIEVVNVGSGHAATSLSEILNRKIMFRVPSITSCDFKETLLKIVGKDNVIDYVLLHFLGDITGRALIVYPSEDAQNIISMITPKMLQNSYDIQTCLLKDISSAVSSAYMDAFGRILGFWVLPTMPEKVAIQAPLSTILTQLDSDIDVTFCAETKFNFRDTGNQLNVHFFLLPDSVSIKLILHKLNV